MKNKKLFLIPVGLTAEDSASWAGPPLREAVLPLRRFVVEHPKSARHFLKLLGLPLQELEFEVLDEHSKAQDLDRLARWLDAGTDVGLLSEAGCPAIADPGAALVMAAHRLGIQVIPLVGPSSIVLALMASGLNGQRFAFNGYLPQSSADREARIRALEESSRRL
ncbi:MAG TPA: SAM-dependent methyltransferase, partial [Burkholderiales bacterium]